MYNKYMCVCVFDIYLGGLYGGLYSNHRWEYCALLIGLVA